MSRYITHVYSGQAYSRHVPTRFSPHLITMHRDNWSGHSEHKVRPHRTPCCAALGGATFAEFCGRSFSQDIVWPYLVRNIISSVRNIISFVRNNISFVRNIISFVRNNISFVRNDFVCTKYYFVCTKWFRLYEILFRLYEITFRLYEILFRLYEILFRTNEIKKITTLNVPLWAPYIHLLWGR